MWTKRDLVNEAYGELALAGYDFDLTPEEMQTALRRLDTMMATWDVQGVHLGYASGASPTASDLDQPSGLPLWAVEAVYMSLAVKLAASKGKAIHPATARNAKSAYDALLSRVATDAMREQQIRGGTPAGAGRKTWRQINQPFLPPVVRDELRVAGNGDLEFSGGT